MPSDKIVLLFSLGLICLLSILLWLDARNLERRYGGNADEGYQENPNDKKVDI